VKVLEFSTDNNNLDKEIIESENEEKQKKKKIVSK